MPIDSPVRAPHSGKGGAKLVAAIFVLAVVDSSEQMRQTAEVLCVRLQIILHFLIGFRFLDIDGKRAAKLFFS